MSDAPTDLSELVRTARVRSGMTQEQFAVRAGITAKTLRSIEQGTQPARMQARVMRGLAAALGVEVSDLHDPEPATAGAAQTS